MEAAEASTWLTLVLEFVWGVVIPALILASRRWLATQFEALRESRTTESGAARVSAARDLVLDGFDVLAANVLGDFRSKVEKALEDGQIDAEERKWLRDTISSYARKTLNGEGRGRIREVWGILEDEIDDFVANNVEARIRRILAE